MDLKQVEENLTFCERQLKRWQTISCLPAPSLQALNNSPCTTQSHVLERCCKQQHVGDNACCSPWCGCPHTFCPFIAVLQKQNRSVLRRVNCQSYRPPKLATISYLAARVTPNPWNGPTCSESSLGLRVPKTGEHIGPGTW